MAVRKTLTTLSAISIGLLAACGSEEPQEFQSCTIETDGDEKILSCPDGTSAVISDSNGESGGCTLDDHGDGSYTIDCEGSEPITLRDGDPGETCTLEDEQGQVTLTCGDEVLHFNVPYCGNGLVEAGQICDQGEANGTCEFTGLSPSCTYCLETCDGYGEATRTVVDGTVVNVSQGNRGILPNLTFFFGDQEITADEYGKFLLEDIDPGIYRVRVAPQRALYPFGYDYDELPLAFTEMEVEIVADQLNPITLRVHQGREQVFSDYYDQTVSGDWSNTRGIQASQLESLSLTLDDEALLSEDGEVFRDTLRFTSHPIIMAATDHSDPASIERFLELNLAIPHPFTEVNGDEERLSIFGAIAVEFHDEDTGEALTFAPGKTAKVIIPGDPHAELPLAAWYFDEDARHWVEHGQVTEADFESNQGLQWGFYEVEIDRPGWWAIGEIDNRDWTCLRGAPIHSGSAVAAEFLGGHSHPSTNDGESFCIDVPRERGVKLRTQLYADILTRYFGEEVLDLHNAPEAACADDQSACLDLRNIPMENLNGYCLNTDGFEVHPNYDGDPPRPLEGNFTIHRLLEISGQTPWQNSRFGLTQGYALGPISVDPNQPGCIPLYWRNPGLALRDMDRTFCEEDWSPNVRIWSMTGLEAPFAPICTDEVEGCFQPGLDDNSFYCGS